MAQTIGEWFARTFPWMPAEVLIFLVSMLPLVELRGGLIVASLLNVNIVTAIVICFVANLVPVPFILWLIKKIFALLKRSEKIAPKIERLEQKSLDKSEKIRKFEFWGLVLFVGIPIPGTGAWTGSLIAALLGIKFKKAFPAITLGLVLATIIMCIVSYLIPYLIGKI